LLLFVAGAAFTLVMMTWPLLLIVRIGANATLTPRADIAAVVDAAAVVAVVPATPIAPVTACEYGAVVAATAALPAVAGAEPAALALRDTA